MAAEVTAKKEVPDKASTPATRKAADVAISEQFTHSIIKEFGRTVGEISLTPYQRRLAQHLFIRIDNALRELEAKRTDKNKAPIIWPNVNMQRLATDAMHRVELGLDALIPGHIWPIPYLNSTTGKYDLDLRIGYSGKDFYKRKMAVEPPMDIIYHLVHKNDLFKPIMRSAKNPIEGYEFEIANPFERGDVIGGFAYMVYEDPTKNRLILVTNADFKKSEARAQSKDFWTNYPEDMKYKTIVNRATKYLTVDPEKVNAAYMAAEREDEVIDVEMVKAEIKEHANNGEVLEIAVGVSGEEKASLQGEEPVKQEEAKPEARKPGF